MTEKGTWPSWVQQQREHKSIPTKWITANNADADAHADGHADVDADAHAEQLPLSATYHTTTIGGIMVGSRCSAVARSREEEEDSEAA
ncbi:GL13807 [Drosophila persimilis]|uniref:GL13807 n=1 Tax=Drosophila persimilis TaxID=7234 RepID=B4GP30_DROPE|nr:GL13807 [Drosophila persimilis]